MRGIAPLFCRFKDSMDIAQTQHILDSAKQQCAATGSQLTPKRQKILELLLNSAVPLSAYEVTAAYNQVNSANMPAMSVYRILDFLESQQLVHKLSSTNKYLACSHIACKHSHAIPQFLTCSSCNKVKKLRLIKILS